jgi:hypothetical protein
VPGNNVVKLSNLKSLRSNWNSEFAQWRAYIL